MVGKYILRESVKLLRSLFPSAYSAMNLAHCFVFLAAKLPVGLKKSELRICW